MNIYADYSTRFWTRRVDFSFDSPAMPMIGK